MNNHFQMGDENKCEGGPFFNFSFQRFFGWLIQTKN